MNSLTLPRTVALTAAFALLAASPAYSDILFQDDFSYVPGTALTGQNGGSGFDSGWTTKVTTGITSTTYDHSIPGGGVIEGGSAGLTLTSTPGSQVPAAIQRALSDSYDSDEIFVSFLVRQTVGSVVNNDRLNFWIGNTDTSSGPYGGLLKTSATTFYIRPNSLAPAGSSATPAFVLDSTYLVVLRFSKSVSGSDSLYDQASIWVNPDQDDFGSPLASANIHTSNLSISSFSTIGIELRGGHASIPNTYYFDQLVGGTTWNDVVPVAIPEPSTLLMGAAGAGALLLSRRRNGKR